MPRPMPEFAPVTRAIWPCSARVEVIRMLLCILGTFQLPLRYAAVTRAFTGGRLFTFETEQTMDLLSRAEAAFLSTAGRLSWIGPTLARLTLGVVFIGTGWGKLHDLDKVTGFFTELGIPAPGFNALLASSISWRAARVTGPSSSTSHGSTSNQ